MKHVVPFFLRSLRLQKMRFVKLCFGLILLKSISAGLPVLLGRGMDKLIKDTAELVLVALSISCAWLSVTLISPVVQRVQTQFIQNTILDVTTRWFTQLFNKELSFFKEQNAGRIVNIIERGIHAHERFLGQLVGVIIPVLVELLIATLYLSQIGGLWGILFVVLSFSLQTFLTLRWIEARRPEIECLNEIEDECAEETLECLSKGVIFQMYRATSVAVERLLRSFKKYADQNVEISRSGAVLSLVPFHFQTLGGLFALGLGHYLVRSQGLSIGSAVMLLGFFGRFSQAAGECIGTFRTLDQFQVDVREALNLLNFQDFKRAGIEVLDVQNVTFPVVSVGKGLINLVPGDRVAVVGASGSGKTTLLDALAGLVPEFRDHMLVNQIPISEINSESQLNLIAYTPQNSMILKGQMEENLFCEKNFNSERKKSILDGFRLNSLGADVRGDISEKTISGGEAKRIANARALLRPAGIYIFDEPTAGLHQELSESTWETILKHTRGSILIAATHEQDALWRFNKILTVSNGEFALTKIEPGVTF